MALHVLVIGDSLTFHGPQSAVVPSDSRLWPQVMASHLGEARGTRVDVDLHARIGWTARDAWWALTRDPRCWGESLPRADALVLATGGMDQLPAAVPTYLREGMSYVRPGALRRAVRSAYRRVAPPVMRAGRGFMRQLPQAATDTYHRRVVEAVRVWRPNMPVVLLGPSPFESTYYPYNGGHAPAVRAATVWARTMDCAMVDVDPLVTPSLEDGSANPDGLHWSWAAHQRVGEAMARCLQEQLG